MRIKWFTELKKVTWEDKPWIILGKGPTFHEFYNCKPNSFNILALNHVGLKLTSKISLFIDLDVFKGNEKKFFGMTKFVLGPHHPHINFKPTASTIEETVKANKQLLQYKLSTWKNYRSYDDQPHIQVKYFCAEAAFQILGHLGIKKVYSLGIDGGTEYDEKFSDLTPLRNRQPNFDKQFFQIKKTCKEFGIDWKKL